MYRWLTRNGSVKNDERRVHFYGLDLPCDVETDRDDDGDESSGDGRTGGGGKVPGEMVHFTLCGKFNILTVILILMNYKLSSSAKSLFNTAEAEHNRHNLWFS